MLRSLLLIALVFSANFVYAEDATLARRYLENYAMTAGEMRQHILNDLYNHDSDRSSVNLRNQEFFIEYMMGSLANELTLKGADPVNLWQCSKQKEMDIQCMNLSKISNDAIERTGIAFGAVMEQRKKGEPFDTLIQNTGINQTTLAYVLYWLQFRAGDYNYVLKQTGNEKTTDTYISYKAFRFTSEKGIELYKQLDKCKKNSVNPCAAASDIGPLEKKVHEEFLAHMYPKSSNKAGN